MKKILCFRVLEPGSAVPSAHMRVLVWASKLELTNVCLDDSSSSLPNVNFGVVSEAIGPTVLPIKTT